MIGKYHNHKLQTNPIAPRGRATQQSRDTRKTNYKQSNRPLFPIKMIAKLE